MSDIQIIWDLEDDPKGNYWHIVEEGHGITREEVDEVLCNRRNHSEGSRSSNNWITFGWTSTGSYIAVLWEHVRDDPLTIYPVTAYPVPEPRRRKRHGR